MFRIGAIGVETLIRRGRAFALVALAAAVLSGCGTVDLVKNTFFPKVPKVEIGEISVLSDPAANLNTALEFEIVLVSDQDVLSKLSALSAAKWFELRDDLRKTYPGAIDSLRWELVPGQDLHLPSGQFKDKRALAVLVYANYLTPGEHRARIDSFHDGVNIRLLPRGFTVTARGDTAQSK